MYSDSVASWTESGDDGANPIRALVYLIPTLLALIGRKRFERINDSLLNICINMSLVSTAIWLIAVVTGGIYIGRLPIYASMFNYILLPYEIDCLFAKKSRQAMGFITVFFYLLYYYYQFHFTWGRI